MQKLRARELRRLRSDTSRAREFQRRQAAQHELHGQHPWRLQRPNEPEVFGVASRFGCAHSGELHCSRWAATVLPAGSAAIEQAVVTLDRRAPDREVIAAWSLIEHSAALAASGE